MKRLIAVLGVFLLAIAALTVWIVINRTDTPDSLGLPDYPTTSLVANGDTYTLLVPRNAQERQLGLGAVAKLPENYGMLFEGSGQIGIWMKGMGYAIDIIWLDGNNRVIHIVHNAQPDSYPETVYYNPSDTDAKMVVELNSGEAKRLGIEIGTILELSR